MAPPPADNYNQTKVVSNDEDDFSYAMELVTVSCVPVVLLSAFRLGVFEIIAEAGSGAQMSATQISDKISLKKNGSRPVAAIMVDRMLYILACHKVLTCSTLDEKDAEGGGSTCIRVYGLAPVARHFLPNKDLGGASLSFFLALTQDKVMNDCWYVLDDAILDGGIPFDMIHGVNAFEYPGRDPRFNKVFNQGMIGHTSIVLSSLLDSYKGFNNLNSLVDVGGGVGLTISRIVAKYPTITGINYDLPHVVQHAPAYPGVQHISGDMFESVPKGDAIFMKWILHDWDDDDCVKLLKNCYKSLPDDGKVIVVDAILPLVPDSSSLVRANSHMNLAMLTLYQRGKERSEEEFMALAKAAGFRGIKKQCYICTLWVMEFYK